MQLLGYLVQTNLPNNFQPTTVMFCATRRRVFQVIIPSQGVLSRTPNSHARSIRTKGGTGFYTDALRRDERLLKVFRFTTFAVNELIR